MNANQNIFGRDPLVNRILELLQREEAESILLMAERRIGKTTVMDLIRDKAPPNVHCTYIEVSKISTTKAFVEALMRSLSPFMETKAAMFTKFKGLVNAAGGTEIGGIIKLPELAEQDWQKILGKLFDTIEIDPDHYLLLLIDELPFMLQKIAHSDGGSEALNVIDFLRALRQDHKEYLRMVFAGSVGLHHVITTLRDNKFASEPVNNMRNMEVGPLKPVQAMDLAKHQLKVEKLKVSSEIVLKICEEADHVPFYIKRIILRLAEDGRPVTIELVEEVVAKQLCDDADDWEMEHFRTRLPIYYPGIISSAQGGDITRSQLATEILDSFAVTDQPLSIADIFKQLKSRLELADQDRKQVVDILRLLSLDHYVKSNTKKEYEFRFPLVKRWWILAQGLTK